MGARPWLCAGLVGTGGACGGHPGDPKPVHLRVTPRALHLEGLARIGAQVSNAADVEFEAVCLDAEGAALVAKGRALASFGTLALVNSRLDDATVTELFPGPGWQPLLLKVTKNGLGVGGLKLMVDSGSLDRVKTLVVRSNPIGDAGVRLLARDPRLGALTRLELNRVELTDAGVDALIRSPHLPNLTWLSLPSNRLTAAGLRGLTDAANLPKLQFATVDKDNLDDATASAIRAARPGLTLTVAGESWPFEGPLLAPQPDDHCAKLEETYAP